MSSWRRVFPSIGPIFKGADVFVVGMGSSLEGFDFEQLRGRHTIALNNAVFHVPEPTIHIYADEACRKRYFDHKYSPETKIVVQKVAYDDTQRKRGDLERQLYQFEIGGPSLAEGPREYSLYVSRTVAKGGINLAWRLGAERVFLLGVDGYRRPDGEYYFDGTPKPRESQPPPARTAVGTIEDRHACWNREMWRLRKLFDRGELYPGPYPGPGIYNLNPLSAIEAWEKVDPAAIFEKETNDAAAS